MAKLHSYKIWRRQLGVSFHLQLVILLQPVRLEKRRWQLSEEDAPPNWTTETIVRLREQDFALRRWIRMGQESINRSEMWKIAQTIRIWRNLILSPKARVELRPRSTKVWTTHKKCDLPRRYKAPKDLCPSRPTNTRRKTCQLPRLPPLISPISFCHRVRKYI